MRAARWGRRFLFLVAMLGLIAAGFFSTLTVHRFIFTSGYFKIHEIRINGASDALEKDARSWLDRQFKKSGDNLVLVKTGVLRAGLATLPRARAASVRRIFPQTLCIDLEEREPLMAVYLDKLYLLDEEGVLIAEARPEMVRRLGLPVLTGIHGSWNRPGARLDQPHLGEILRAAAFVRQSDPFLGDRIVEWNLNSREEITAILNTRTEVRFGDRSPLETLDKLSSALTARKELEHATYIDLRMEKQIVYK